MLCKYEVLVTDPGKMINRIYNFAGLSYPKSNITNDVNAESIGRGAHLRLSSEIEALCCDLWGRLNDVDAAV